MYACETHDEAMSITHQYKLRRIKEEKLNAVDNYKEMHDLKKGMTKLTKMEKKKLYGGDSTILYEKMGLVEESDIEKYRKKLGIKKDVDLSEVDIDKLLLSDKDGGVVQSVKGKK